MDRRVVVTGMGILAPIGLEVETFWANCLAGRTNVAGIPPVWRRYTDVVSTIWSPLPDLDFSPYPMGPREMLQMDEGAMLGMAAACQALRAAGIPMRVVNEKTNRHALEGLDPRRVGVFIGTGVGGIHTTLRSHEFFQLSRQVKRLEAFRDRLGASGAAPAQAEELGEILADFQFPPRLNPFTVAMSMPNASAGALSVKFGLEGPSTTLCASCASSTIAIGHAFRAIRQGRVDHALTGGTEYLHDDCGSVFHSFDVANTLVQAGDDPQRANRPFDEARTGFLFSQGGGAMLVLEELEAARRRGAPIVAELVSFAESSDGHSMMAMCPDGASIRRMLQELLDGADLPASAVDYVNAHGTGTRMNDELESDIIATVFGQGPLVNSTKSLVGHTLGASGAIEAVVACLSLRDGTTHACRNLERPVRDLRFVREVGSHPIRTALSQSFGFGGHNAGLLFKAWSPI